MPHLLTRASLSATPLAIVIGLLMTVGVAAQVATLTDPAETLSPAPGDSGVALESADREDALLAYAECMRDNGIDMDDPQVGEGGRGGFLRAAGAGRGTLDQLDKTFLVAQEACGTILEAARPELDLAVEQERLEAQLDLAECLRAHGYPDYPDPALDPDGRMQRGGQQLAGLDIDRRSEEFQAALTTCADELGTELVGPGGGIGRGRGEG